MTREKTRILAVDNEPTGVKLLKAILVPVGMKWSKHSAVRRLWRK